MIQLQSITLRNHYKLLLDNAGLVINPQEKVALVGRNGAGKSSLFALLSGRLSEDSGNCSIPTHWHIAQVAQELPQTTQNITDFVLGGDARLTSLTQQLKLAEQQENGMLMAELHTALFDAGAGDAKARAQALLLGLGFNQTQFDNAVKNFSGGWQMRLQLARALMAPSDLLLLDEPTNHLDLDALIWLENWLRQYQGTLIVISHDREFLDAATNVTVHLDNLQLTRYSGNYSYFEAQYQQQLLQQQHAYSLQQEKIAHLQSFIDRFKAKASKAKQAQSRVKALARLQLLAPTLKQAEFNFSFTEPQQLPDPMLKMENLSCGYTATIPVVSSISKTITPGQRIGLLGANGQGKSTLVKTIVTQLPALGGNLLAGKGLRIGYFAQQELDVLTPQNSALEHLIALTKQDTVQGISRPQREQDLRNYLGQFNFSGDMVHQSVATMSGGEKARLLLALLVWQQPNLLILDEPTNHLDLITRQALSLALNSFSGSLLLVSHDRSLLRSVCDEFWLISNGQLTDFNGDLIDYQHYILQQAKLAKEALTSKSPKPAANNKAATKLKQRRLQALTKKLKLLETELAKLEGEKNNLNAKFDSNQLTPQELQQSSLDFAELQQRLEQTENSWLELSAELEILTAEAEN